MRRYVAGMLCMLFSLCLCLNADIVHVYAADFDQIIMYEDPKDQKETQDSEKNRDSEESQDKEDTTEKNADGAADVSAPSAILMEASTGQVIYEKDADNQRPPASVTKVMTLLLIFDALEQGKIKLEDEVTTSEYAASMGGSQVFLEPGEVQTVDTMIKCISVASANDACVAMAELIAGTEEEFVAQMNQRAKELGKIGRAHV